MNSRIETITNLCRLARCPERAAAFIFERKSVTDVLAELSGGLALTPSERFIGAGVRVRTESNHD